jgi:DNA-binding PadR family transcriptional regulator
MKKPFCFLDSQSKTPREAFHQRRLTGDSVMTDPSLGGCRGGARSLCHAIDLKMPLHLLRFKLQRSFMAPGPQLGEFEQVVLLAILRLEDDAYGVTIRNEIEECTGREPAPGALYTTLDRLEEKGLVRSRMGDPTPERGGRAKRYFTVSAKGIKAVTHALRNYRRLIEGLELPGLTYAPS